MLLAPGSPGESCICGTRLFWASVCMCLSLSDRRGSFVARVWMFSTPPWFGARWNNLWRESNIDLGVYMVWLGKALVSILSESKHRSAVQPCLYLGVCISVLPSRNICDCLKNSCFKE